VNIENTKGGGWNCTFDKDAIEELALRSPSVNSVENATPGSQQELEEIERSVHTASKEKTDEDLVQAFNEAMAVDIEPESEEAAAAAALADKYSPGKGNDASEDLADILLPSLGHEIT
jgi:hypothetical protein